MPPFATSGATAVVVGLAAETAGRTRTEVGSAPAGTATEVEDGASTETTEVMATAGAVLLVILTEDVRSSVEDVASSVVEVSSVVDMASSVVDVVVSSAALVEVEESSAAAEVLLATTSEVVKELSAKGTEVVGAVAAGGGGTSKVEVRKAAGIETVVTPTPPLACGNPLLSSLAGAAVPAGAPATTPGTSWLEEHASVTD